MGHGFCMASSRHVYGLPSRWPTPRPRNPQRRELRAATVAYDTPHVGRNSCQSCPEHLGHRLAALIRALLWRTARYVVRVLLHHHGGHGPQCESRVCVHQVCE